VVEHHNPLHNPFQDYIDHVLDLHGIIGSNTDQVSHELHELFDVWLSENGGLTPNDYLDDLQTDIRTALTREIIESPLIRQSSLSAVDPQALTWLIRLSITLAYAFHAEIGDRDDEHQPRPDDDCADARRLRRTLMLTTLYARRTAWTGDPIAQRITIEAEAVLDATERLK